MAKKDIIRVGDTVKIVNPRFIKRWGYDNNLQDTKQKVFDRYGPKMIKFVEEILIEEGIIKKPVPADKDFPWSVGLCSISNKGKYMLAAAIAYEIVGYKMKDGAERKLFYYDKNPTYYHNDIVTDIKIVQTGIYFSPTTGGGYDPWTGDYDCGEPGGLTNVKVHKLLEIAFDVWIEDCDVEKIKSHE